MLLSCEQTQAIVTGFVFIALTLAIGSSLVSPERFIYECVRVCVCM